MKKQSKLIFFKQMNLGLQTSLFSNQICLVLLQGEAKVIWLPLFCFCILNMLAGVINLTLTYLLCL